LEGVNRYFMFSMFPEGWPGMGLLLLRVTGGIFLACQGGALFINKVDLVFLRLAVALILIAIGLLLLIGFLSRYAALLAAILGMCSAYSWFPVSNVGPLIAPTTIVLSTAIMVAVICLGPGAFSLDARLFGRREIVIPPSSSRG